MIIQCKVCNKDFYTNEARKSKRLTCSIACRDILNPKRPLREVKCGHCGKDFTTTKTNRKCCSKECRDILKSKSKRIPIDGYLSCTKCGHSKTESDFYQCKRTGYRYYCKQCDDTLIYAHQVKRKKTFVEYKGGKCIKCGYNKYIGALDFHHRDPNEKEFNISTNYSIEQMKAELDKCDLLCANCHREEHGDFS